MKVSKIPGLGRFGVYIDDVDLKNISHEEWMEIGKLHLKSLVTIIRGNDLDHATYYDLVMQWGTARFSRPLNFYLKYGRPVKELVLNNLLDEEDKRELRLGRLWQPDKRRPGMIRVTGKRNERGEPLGVFSNGELYWHSNECSDPAFTPGVTLMGWENMKGSCTGFCTTVDWWERQTDSFRSEVRELISVNNYNPGSFQANEEQDQQQFYRNNQAPIPNGEIPLVIKSAGGIEGLHLPATTFQHFKGMSREESKKLYDLIWAGVMEKEYCYEHWYQNDKDILCFDNSITLHNRKVEDEERSRNRVGYRVQYDYTKLVDDYRPFAQEQYNLQRDDRMRLMKIATQGMEHA
jgi:alpha-ketoglutarate-dependent taurine dioxygenase